jgi:hypothetical protein
MRPDDWRRRCRVHFSLAAKLHLHPYQRRPLTAHNCDVATQKKTRVTTAAAAACTMSDVRTVQRDMRRVASILNEVFDVQANTMCWDVLEEAPRLRDGVFKVHSRPCSKKSKEPIVPPDASASTKKTFVSLNKCRQAILWNTG